MLTSTCFGRVKSRLLYGYMKLQHTYEAELIGFYSPSLEMLKHSKQPVLQDTIEYVKDTSSDCLTTRIVFKHTSETWVFTLTALKAPQAIAFLYDKHRTYFTIDQIVAESSEKTVDLPIPNKQEWTSQNSLCLNSTEITFVVTVKFYSDVYGLFRQSVIFNYGSDEILCKNLCVDVVPREQFQKYEEIQQEIALVSEKLWKNGDLDIIPFTTTDVYYNEDCDHSNNLKKVYCNLASTSLHTLPRDTFIGNLSTSNYCVRMHSFLYMEELARSKEINKFNIKARLHVVNSYMLATSIPHAVAKYSNFGELFAYIKLNHTLSVDTSWGRLLLNNCLHVLLRVEHSKVYEALIEDRGQNTLYLRLSARIVRDLGLQHNITFKAQLQFQINSLPFSEWHYAVDALPDLNVIFPDTYLEPLIPWSPHKQWCNNIDLHLNVKQKEALIAITTPLSIQLPPILLIGSFGTGKTFTLAQAVKEILKQDNTKILICTHSNSAADIYIKDYFHEYYKNGQLKVPPLRIYYHKRWVYSVHPTVQQYCLINEINKTRTFQQPSHEDIEKHRIIVTTLSTSMYLCNLKLPNDYFTHILLDEAAQTFECEAIMPFFVATRSTRIVLAGDHMQLSPEIYSNIAKECNLHLSLLERLNDLYPPTFPCKILLCENYRAHETIIDFTSEMFYKEKLVATGKQKKHPTLYPLTFFVVKGEDVQDSTSTSFYNNSEVYEIVDRVSDLKNEWPEAWGTFNEQSIGILTPYSDQVFHIRAELRKRHLGSVSVERVLNVQGKQFRAVFLSIVRTEKTCNGSSETNHDYGFLSDLKLLNTAITRAQSLVAVFGDPIAMCTIGHCRKVWEEFLNICGKNGSLNGITLETLKLQLDGLELKKIYGLNPLAPEFVPRSLQVGNEKPSLHAGLSEDHNNLQSMCIYSQPMQIFNHPPNISLAPYKNEMPTRLHGPPVGQFSQSQDKVHKPDIAEGVLSFNDLMNVLPVQMSLANVLQAPPWFHEDWYNHLINNKGVEAAQKYKYFLTAASSKPQSGIPLQSDKY